MASSLFSLHGKGLMVMMMKRASIVGIGLMVLAIWFLVSPTFGSNGTIEGSVTTMDMHPIRSTMAVRAWKEGPRGWVLEATTQVDGSGNYSLEVPPGEYKLDVRLTAADFRSEPGHPAEHNRPYDEDLGSAYWRQEMWHEGPSGESGWQERTVHRQEHATPLPVGSNQSIEGINFPLFEGSAIRGRVSMGGTYMAGIEVRVEQADDWRRHNFTETIGPSPGHAGRLGQFRSRGIRSAQSHRIIAYDRDGNYETTVLSDEVQTTAGERVNIDTFDMPAFSAWDPYFGNDSLDEAFNIGRAGFGSEPPEAWESSSQARIAPRNTGRVNWFCWSALEDERFIVTASTQGTISGLSDDRYCPWTDPHIKVVYRDNGNTIPGGEDNLSGPGALDARVDTGVIPRDRDYCVAVTTFGDSNFDGHGQQTAGRYRLTVEMGTRPPWLEITDAEFSEDPPAWPNFPNPSNIGLAEGMEMTLFFEFGAPDGDENLEPTVTLTDEHGNPPTNAPSVSYSYNVVSEKWEGELVWEAGLEDAGTYELVIEVEDVGENVSVQREVNLLVGAVNYPPTIPEPESPEDGQVVDTRSPEFQFRKSDDPDGPNEELTYEVQIYYEAFDPDSDPDIEETGISHGADDGGVVTWTAPVELPEKETACWRVRAQDSGVEVPGEDDLPPAYSAWSGVECFVVHSIPPEIEAFVGAEQIDSGDEFELDEGDLLVIELTYRAPAPAEGDEGKLAPVPDLWSNLLDTDGEPVSQEPGLEVLDDDDGEGAAVYRWQVGALDAADSPYTVTFSAYDGRLTTEHYHDITVHEKNLPPTAPIMVLPEDDSSVSDLHPVFVAENATDPEGEDMYMHFQVSKSDAFEEEDIVLSTPPMSLPQDESEGVTSWQSATPLEWGTDYWVRAYAKDIHELAGPSSDPHLFRAPENIPPTTPVHVSPENGLVIDFLTPTLRFEKSEDPDGDDEALSYDLEVWFSDPSEGGNPERQITDIEHTSGVGGVISVPLDELPEKQMVWWRVRANDHQSQHQYSDWTEPWSFFTHAYPPEVLVYLEEEPAPEFIDVYEGDTVVLDILYQAPYGPVPNLTAELRDVYGRVHDGEYELEILDATNQVGEAAWTWWVGALDSERSPYRVAFVANDGRYTTEVIHHIEVDSRNLPPTSPVLLEPEPGEILLVRDPVLLAKNAVDPEGEAVFMHFEIAADAAFDSVVSRTPPSGVPQDEQAGQTSWRADPPLDWGRDYWVRAYATDVHGVVGDYTDTHAVSLRQNQQPSDSEMEGDLAGAQCSAGHVVTHNPFILPVNHGSDPDGDPVWIHLQMYPYGETPEDTLVLDTKVPVDEGEMTQVEIDLGVIPVNERYSIRVRSWDGALYSDNWHECNIWNNVRNTEPTPIVILDPDPANEENRLRMNTTEVRVTVQNAYDVDTVVPGAAIDIAWCSSLDPTFSDCPEFEADWDREPQSSFDPGDISEFTVTGLTNLQQWYIKACALDEANVCGPADTTSVIVGEESDFAVPSGCCTTARGGDPWFAMLALLAIALMAPRPRHRRT